MNKRIMWALVGFVAVAILTALGLSIGMGLSVVFVLEFTEITESSIYLIVPLVSLASGIIGAVYFSVLYLLYARGRRLAAYLSIFFIALALILPVILGPNMDPLGAVLTFYLPGAFITLLLIQLLPLGVEFGWFGLFIAINISWVVWGLLGLGIGYLLEKLSNLASKGAGR
ncbi:MAG TPA: hypothetical protein VE439_07560 [Anaerolineae bacterium]|nr:hypothetical protein [Anaerolineae bacterium]